MHMHKSKTPLSEIELCTHPKVCV